MGLSEANTRAKLIDPALHGRGWTEDLIRREETAGAIKVIEGSPGSKPRAGWTTPCGYVRINPNTQPIVMALIKAKAAYLPPTYGLE